MMWVNFVSSVTDPFFFFEFLKMLFSSLLILPDDKVVIGGFCFYVHIFQSVANLGSVHQ